MCVCMRVSECVKRAKGERNTVREGYKKKRWSNREREMCVCVCKTEGEGNTVRERGKEKERE